MNSNGEILVSSEDVSKKFCKRLRRSMAYGIFDLTKNLFGFKPDSSNLRKNEFWALNQISFKLSRGEALGLIGVNGCGKTTLLRLIAGIFPPDKGILTVKGRVGALIAVGAGFHPHMTGRENVYLNGSILGMTTKEIDKNFNMIVNFAEIEDFLEAPLSTYSTGMRIRLGFAIATAIKPDLLLLDEILAVGDIAFQNKCFNRMNELINEGTGVILVSHQIQRILQYTKRTLWLDNGRIIYDGNTDDACQKYIQESQKRTKSGSHSFQETLSGFHIIRSPLIKNVTFKINNQNLNKTLVKNGEEMFFSFSFFFMDETDKLEIGIAIYRDDGLQLLGFNTLTDYQRISVKNNLIQGSLFIKNIILVPGIYAAALDIKIGQHYLFRGHSLQFQVISDRVHFGFIDLHHEWKISC
jgi:lipopolysaccharide transport system ATP-binding protein